MDIRIAGIIRELIAEKETVKSDIIEFFVKKMRDIYGEDKFLRSLRDEILPLFKNRNLVAYSSLLFYLEDVYYDAYREMRETAHAVLQLTSISAIKELEDIVQKHIHIPLAIDADNMENKQLWKEYVESLRSYYFYTYLTIPDLDKREQRIVNYAIQGKTPVEITDLLCEEEERSEDTVEGWKTKTFVKLKLTKLSDIKELADVISSGCARALDDYDDYNALDANIKAFLQQKEKTRTEKKSKVNNRTPDEAQLKELKERKAARNVKKQMRIK